MIQKLIHKRLCTDHNWRIIQGVSEKFIFTCYPKPKTDTMHTYIIISENVRDVVDHMLLIVRNMEKEEGKDATVGLTEEHYHMTIADFFSGKSKSGKPKWLHKAIN